mgnify:FL=1
MAYLTWRSVNVPYGALDNFIHADLYIVSPVTSAFYGFFLFVLDGESVTSLFCLRIHQVRVGFNGIIKTSKGLSTEEAFLMMAFKELERRVTLFSDHSCSSSC